MPFISRVSVACLLGASLLVSCGGGGGGSSSTPTPPPPTNTGGGGASNSAPVAVASSAVSTVTGGGQFTVSATGSSDPDGDNLTFTWTQTAGPNALSGTIQTANLTLNAPNVTQDTQLTFQVTASDGTDSSTDTVTVTAQPIGSPVTVRPSAPINTDVAILFGLTNVGADQYQVYWSDSFVNTGNNIISSQVFSDDGAPVGDQVNGSFVLPQVVNTVSRQINSLFPISVIENGGTIYTPIIHIFEAGIAGLGVLIGPLEGDLSPVEDPFENLDINGQSDQAPIGQNSLVNVTTRSISILASVSVDVVGPDGSVETAPIAFEEVDVVNGLVSSISDPGVSAIGNDGYIVAWRREDSNQSPRLRTIEAQIYTAGNALSGTTITVDGAAGPNSGDVSQLDAAAFGNGNTLITWVESQNFAANGDFIDFIVRGRIVSPDGTFASNEFTVSESVNDQFVTQALSLNNGDVLVIWGEGDSILKARLISTLGPVNTLGAEFDLSQNVPADVFNILQTQTGRVLIGYNLPVGNSALTSEIISFCPVGCE